MADDDSGFSDKAKSCNGAVKENECKLPDKVEKRNGSGNSTTMSEADKNKKSAKQSELSKYWKTVNENPNDFTGWTYLLQFVEQQKNTTDAQEAFDKFLEKYPYCFGYWRKYAEMERKYGTALKAENIYERGIKSIPLSVDLWLHYINFYPTTHDLDEDLVEKQRALYVRAIAAAGTDFRSDKIWDSYITFEESNKALVNVTTIYDKLFTIPTQLYSHHMDQFKKHVESHHPREILSLDEFFKLRREVFVDKPGFMDTGEADEALDTGPPGSEEAAPGTDSTTSQVFDESEVPELRAKIIGQREDVYSNNEMEVSRRWAFEEAIKRPYFHVKPLERSQLKNWREYLDYELDNGSHERIVVLFERCIIACALYDEFWLKYTRYMEAHNTSSARSLFTRVCGVHLPKKPTIFFAWAAFEERVGQYEAALDVLSKLEKNVPRHAVITLRRVGVHRRRGDHSAVEGVYRKCVEDAETMATKSFYAIKHARYMAKVLGDVERSREILKEAIDRDQNNGRLYLQLIDIEYQSTPISVEAIDTIFVTALASDLSLPTKIQFSQRRVDFLEDFGMDVEKVTNAYSEHQRLIKEHGSEKKRRPSVTEAEDKKESQPSEKKSKHSAKHDTPPSTTSNEVTYPNADNSMYNGGYISQSGYEALCYQRWANYAQATQAQGQYNYAQWRPY